MMKWIKNFLRLRTSAKSQRGVTIVENLIALTLFAIVIAGSSRFIIAAMRSNTSSRTYLALVSDVQQIVDGYRKGTYSTLLSNFGSVYTSIANNQTVTLTSSTKQNARATFTTTLTAIKTSNTSFPEAIKVRVAATQRRGKFGNATYSFETVIAQFGT
jgi:Tfp pilus assembly protein PilV